jgi:hypothetical protein
MTTKTDDDYTSFRLPYDYNNNEFLELTNPNKKDINKKNRPYKFIDEILPIIDKLFPNDSKEDFNKIIEFIKTQPYYTSIEKKDPEFYSKVDPSSFFNARCDTKIKNFFKFVYMDMVYHKFTIGSYVGEHNIIPDGVGHIVAKDFYPQFENDMTIVRLGLKKIIVPNMFKGFPIDIDEIIKEYIGSARRMLQDVYDADKEKKLKAWNEEVNNETFANDRNEEYVLNEELRYDEQFWNFQLNYSPIPIIEKKYLYFEFLIQLIAELISIGRHLKIGTNPDHCPIADFIKLIKDLQYASEESKVGGGRKTRRRARRRTIKRHRTNRRRPTKKNKRKSRK